MGDLELLKDLFDEKIFSVINLFLKYPEKQFYLSEIAKLSGVNISSTFRLIKKLLDNDIIRATEIGKVKIYQLGSSEKSIALMNLLTKSAEKDPLQPFIKNMKADKKVKRIILESKTANAAKFIIIADSVPIANLEKYIQDTRREFGFKIQVMELTETQFASLKLFKHLEVDNQVIWERKN